MKLISVELDEEIILKLKQLAKSDDRSMSSEIRVAINKYISERE